MEEIYYLNQELKKAMDRHEALLSACTSLQIQADEMLIKAKRSRFRRTMDFSDFLRRVMERDDMRLLETAVSPLFGLKIRKTFQLGRLEDLLACRPEDEERGEELPAGEEENYVFEDDLEEERIRHNHRMFLKILFAMLLQRKSFTLSDLHYFYVMKFTDTILRNGDYYAFLVHLSQKEKYDMALIRENPDTFLEQVMADMVIRDRNREYEDLKFTLKFLPEERIAIGEKGYLTNIRFERQGM